MRGRVPRLERAIPSRRADQGRDCGAAEIQRIAEMLRTVVALQKRRVTAGPKTAPTASAKANKAVSETVVEMLRSDGPTR
jgi:hypothetical protein